MSSRSRRLLWIAAVAAGCQGNVNNGWNVPTYTIRSSVHPDSSEANRHCSSPSISGDGRFVVFATKATNLAPGVVVSGLYSQIYISDVDAGTLKLLTTDAGDPSQEGNGDGVAPAISANGDYVAFQSNATNLVAGTTVGGTHDNVYIFSLVEAGKRLLVSVKSGSTTEEANKASESPSLSEDGSIVVFQSGATDLDPAVTASNRDVYWRRIDMKTPAVEDLLHVSKDQGGGLPETAGPAPATSTSPRISAKGDRVVFLSDARDLEALCGAPGITYTYTQVFVRDIDVVTPALGATTTLVTVNLLNAPSKENSSGVAISGDGAVVAFASAADDLAPADTNQQPDVFVRDLSGPSTTRISINTKTKIAGSGASTQPAISMDGRFVAFRSVAANLVEGDVNGMADIFLHDRLLGVTRRVSLSTYGVEASSVVPSGETAGQHQPALNADGRFVAYVSSAPNLVVGDGNDKDDVFVSGPLYGE